jgi:putative phosphoesterase
MKVGVLADVHANLPALEAALSALRERGAEAWICAGDLVGYGPHPNECVARVAELGATCVAGNHDLIALGRLPPDRCIALARRTLEWTRAVLSADARTYLEGLPVTAELGGVLVAHGSLDDPEEYVARRSRALAELARAPREARALVLGHTHRTLVAVAGDGRLVLNPGAVGQSRDLLVRARCAVLDTEWLRVERLSLRYDADRTRSDLVRAGLPPAAVHLRPSLPRSLARAVRARR